MLSSPSKDTYSSSWQCFEIFPGSLIPVGDLKTSFHVAPLFFNRHNAENIDSNASVWPCLVKISARFSISQTYYMLSSGKLDSSLETFSDTFINAHEWPNVVHMASFGECYGARQ